jgi:hypothetical protein
MEAHRGIRSIEVLFFFSPRRWMGWVAAISLGKRRGTHCTGGLVDSRNGLDGCTKFRPYRASILGPSIPQGVDILTTSSRLTSTFRLKLKIDTVYETFERKMCIFF